MSDTIICGKITKEDPKLRFIPSGKAVCNFSVRVPAQKANEKYGREARAAAFVSIVAWDKLAENVAESLKQGDEIVVVGREQERSWTKNDGTEVTEVEIVANKVAIDLTWRPVIVERTEHTAGAPALASF